jgi:uncharacterized repeat protein (TIGR03806 family)
MNLIAIGPRIHQSLALAAWTVLGFAATLWGAQSDVLTEHFNNQRTGENAAETILTPAAVQSGNFGKLFGFGTVNFSEPEGQVLYVANQSIAGGTHNVIYIHDGACISAYDADAAVTYLGNAYYWHTQLATTNAPWNTNAAAIDKATNAIYVVVGENGGAVSLCALDLTTGAHKTGSPVAVQIGTWPGQPVANTVPGTGGASSGGRLAFNPTMANCRPAVLVDNNSVWIAFSRNGDSSGFHGWVFAYDATTLAQQGAFCTTPNGGGGGIWQTDAGLAADASHNVYFATGNGTFDASTGGKDYGMCFIKANLASPLNADLGTNIVVNDWFSPYNQLNWSNGDADIGSTGVILIPGTNKMVSGGTKYGFMYLLEYQNYTAPATSMGHFDASGTADHQTNVQSLPTGAGTQGQNGQNPTCWNSPSGQFIYHWAPGTTLKAYQYNATSGQLNTTPASQNSATSGGYTCVTSNGGSNAILWAYGSNSSGGVLYALNPADVSQEYWDSTQKSADGLPPRGAWQFPMAVNGKVYITTYNGINVYGLFTAAPVFTSVTVAPATANVVVQGTQTFTATALDQNSNPLSPQPAFSWSVAGGGSISAGGVFTAGVAPGGPFTVTAHATSGSVTLSGTANVTVKANITVAPSTETVAINTPYTFTAVALDAGGNPLTTQPTFSWSVSGGGAISSGGVFTAGGTTGGPYTVTATAGGSSGSASVLVTSAPYGVDTRGALSAYLNGHMPTTSLGAIPATLSAAGAFANVSTMAPTAGLVPYTVNTPLWSDAALKSRWTALASGTTVAFAPTGEWSWPNGTVFIKNFSLGTDDTNPAVVKRLETRVLVRDAHGAVYGVTYQWRADNSDADLVPSAGTSAVITISTAGGGTRTQTWYFPSQSDCVTCHTAVSGGVLGVKSRQLNGSYAYPGSAITDNQLRTWNHLNMFTTPVNEASISGYPALSAVGDTNASLQQRSRSYLDANCFACHQPGGASNSAWDARYDTPLASQGIVGALPVNGLGVVGAHVVTPASTAQSVLYLRLDTVLPDPITMPPLARHLIDTTAVTTIASWIGSLTSQSPSVVTGASASPNPVTGTTSALTVLGSDPAGASTLTYSWAATGTPPAAVAFSPNGTNAAHATTATFTKAGTYVLQATLRDGGGFTAISSLTVTVVQTLTTLSVTPATIAVAPNGAQPFSATAKDQFGTALLSQPAVAWTVSGGGTISAAGMFTAGASAGGPFTVTASAAAVHGTAQVTVSTSAAPTITAVTPTTGGAGTVVTISGTNLGGVTSVSFGGTYATFSVNGAGTQITATVPAGAGSGPIVVSAPSGSATAAVPFTSTDPAGSAQAAAPSSGSGKKCGLGSLAALFGLVLGLIRIMRLRERP